MSNRVINVDVSDSYISMTGDTAGASGAMKATTMRMTFDDHWAGTSKTVYFTDAMGEASVSVLLSADALVDGTAATYDVPIPAEAMTAEGLASVTVCGIALAADNMTVIRKITTKAAKFRVMDSEIPSSASNEAAVTATDKQQMQAALDKVVSGESSRVDAENARVAAEEARQNTETGYVAQAADSAQAAAASAAAAQSVVLGQIPDASLTMAKMAQDVTAELESKAEIEFLDNTDFTNPVAQAGIGGLHGSVAYAVDRWKLLSGTVSWDSNGLTLNGTIRQIREFAIGFPVVPSIEMHSGTATITYDDSAKYCDITSSGGTIKRAHLGLIAITDWAKIPPTNYLDTLRLCQGRFIRFPLFSGVGYNIIKTDGFNFFVDLPTTMRAIPSATANLSSASCPVGAITAISIDNNSINNRIFLTANTSTSIANYSTTAFWNIINLDLIADL